MTPRVCVVVPSNAVPWWRNASLEYETCGKPVFGERAGFPMCKQCFALFDPHGQDADWAVVNNEIKHVETIEDPEGRI